MGSVVRFALTLYLVTHGVPVAGDVDFRSLVTVFVQDVLAQLARLR